MNFKSEKIVPEYLNLIGWREHHDTDDISIPASLQQTETGEYYQQKHPALALDVIQTLIPANYELDQYLVDVVTDSSNEIFNDLIQYRQLKDYGKTILENATLLNKYGSIRDRIVNQSRFVGFQIRTKAITGLTAIIEAIGLQFDGAKEFKLYLFHSSKKQPIKTIDVTTTGNGWDWTLTKEELSAYNSDQFHGGVFILGYYQDDLEGVSAINYSNFDWNVGECQGCNNSHFNTWRSIRSHFQVYPLYVPNGSFTTGEMFDLNDAFYTRDQSFGLNLKFSAVCDLTDFFIQNKFAFKNLLALKVVYKILNMMKFSQQINAVEENIKMMIIRDLEGDIDTKLMNIPTQYHKELKSVSFNISGINSVCLNCEEDGHGPTYGVL